MALLPILQYPDPRLRKCAEAVVNYDKELHQIVKDMYETMYHHHGLGLAATQVNIHKRIFVMDVSETRDQKICVVNPEIQNQTGEQIDYHGCLSVGGGISDKIIRSQKVLLKGFNELGEPLELEAVGVMAICVQHEIDHLDGMLFIHHLSQLKQNRIREKLEKLKKRKTNEER